MNDDIGLTTIDGDLVEAGYPIAALDGAIASSQEGFRVGLSEWEEGDNWTGARPKGLADGIDRNAHKAVSAFERGDDLEARKELGDALNYLLFLRDLIDRDGDDR